MTSSTKLSVHSVPLPLDNNQAAATAAANVRRTFGGLDKWFLRYANVRVCADRRVCVADDVNVDAVRHHNSPSSLSASLHLAPACPSLATDPGTTVLVLYLHQSTWLQPVPRWLQTLTQQS